MVGRGRLVGTMAVRRRDRARKFQKRVKATDSNAAHLQRAMWVARPFPGSEPAARMHKCRTKKAAARNLITFFSLLLTKGIISVRRLQQLPEVKRLRHLLQAGRRAACPKRTLMALLLLDAAVRDPGFTAALTHELGKDKRAKMPAETLLMRALQLRRRQGNRTFWRGRFVAHLMKGADTWTPKLLLEAAGVWAKKKNTARATTLLKSVQSLPHVGEYLSHCVVRLCGAALDLSIRDCSDSAANMSAHVEVLHDVVPFRSMRGALIEAGIEEARSWSWGMMSAVYCESSKALREFKVLQDFKMYKGEHSSASADLAGNVMKELIMQLKAAGLQADRGSPETAAMASALKIREPMKTFATLKRFRAAVGPQR
jgi:hypothetical protein